MKKDQFFGTFLVLMATILWGTTGSAQAFAPTASTPLAIGALRMAIGGSLLMVLALVKGAFKKKQNWNKKYILLGALSMAAYQPLFFAGVSLTGIAFGTVIAIGSAPVFTGIIEYFKGADLTKSWFWSTLLAVGGCILLYSGQAAFKVDLVGTFFALGAGLSYALYVQGTKRLLKDSPGEAVNALIFFCSGIILLPLLFMQDLTWLFTIRGMLVSMHIGILATALAYSLFVMGLVHVSTPTAVTLTLGEPLTASLLGILVFKEQLTIISLLGIGIIFIGILASIFFQQYKK